MSKTILILLNGKAGVGKDTFINYCIQNSKSYYPCNILNYHRSDRAKTAMRVLGWEDKQGKNETVRTMLKSMVDYMEDIGTLDRDLEQQIQICSLRDRDQIIFYQVRDPKVIKKLMDHYQERDELSVLSVLITRGVPAEEPIWWDDLEKAPYDMTIQLPANDLDKTAELAQTFMSYLRAL